MFSSTDACVSCSAVTPSTVMVAALSFAATPLGSDVAGSTSTRSSYVVVVPAGTVASAPVSDFSVARPPVDVTSLAIAWARTPSGAPSTS